MPLDPGSTFGRYEILSQVGAGGMGEVYRARDSTLNRDVALKILPTELAIRGDRMLRFMQEAKAAAALNHPNVAHVYEIGEHEGVPFISMEFVDGSTLREKIHYENVELRKLIKYLQQVASGLAKAHAAGIVHRDLKPDNIMITRDGYAKILDFGLAKLIEIPTPGPGRGTISDAATVALEPRSIPGRLMGTIGYMSPEQAQGKPGIDHRSDIFSFGCMLFEAATKHRPFQGDSNVESLYNICYKPAPPIAEFNPAAPRELQKIVRRCLEKDPDERYHSIQDVALELKEVRREMEGDTQFDRTVPPGTMSGETLASQSINQSRIPLPPAPTFAEQTSTGEVTQQRTTSIAGGQASGSQRRKLVVFAVSIALLLAAALFVMWAKFWRNGAREPFRAMNMTRLTTGGRIGNAAIRGYTSISPDGKYVVFRTTENGRDSLWLRQVSSGSLVKIVPDADGKIGGTTFSRDGELIYYSVFDTTDPLGTLYQLPALGGEPRRIMRGVTSPVAISPDGKQLAFVRPAASESALLIANIDGTGEHKLATRQLPNYFSQSGGPAWSPDGKTIACGAGSFSGSLSATIISVPVGGGAETAIVTHQWVSVSRVLWLDDGSGLIATAVPELVSAGTQLWYVSYPAGKVRRITNDLNAYGTSSLGLSADSKTVVTVQADKSAQVWVLPQGGEAIQITNGKYDGDSIGWSDGQILYTTPSGEQSDIWTTSIDGATSKQLTNDGYIESVGCVAGGQIVFSSNRSGNFNLWRMGISGGDQKQLTQGAEFDSRPECSPDGQWIFFRSFRQGKSAFWKMPASGGEPQPLTDESASSIAISPDGKLIAIRYFPANGSANRIEIIPFGGDAPIKTLPLSVSVRDVGLGWTADSKALVFVDSRDNADNLWSVTLDGAPAKQLTSFKSGLIFAFETSRDGKVIAMSRGTQTDDVILLRDSE
ncbi:MAG TPA: protein kinase [Pyrinomonadaceae bacterium]|nr:protein kinase [Pyrinomonadaceae bacterium]